MRAVICPLSKFYTGSYENLCTISVVKFDASDVLSSLLVISNTTVIYRVGGVNNWFHPFSLYVWEEKKMLLVNLNNITLVACDICTLKLLWGATTPTFKDFLTTIAPSHCASLYQITVL